MGRVVGWTRRVLPSAPDETRDSSCTDVDDVRTGHYPAGHERIATLMEQHSRREGQRGDPVTDRIVEGKRPPSLEYSPNFLSQVQTAAALGISIHQLHRMEKELPDFPKRQALPFSKQRKFRRDDLLAWYETSRQEIGA